MKVVWKKEEGQLGGVAGTILFLTVFAFSLWLVYRVNSDIVFMSWKGFTTYMKPDYLYPDINGGQFGTNNALNVLLGAKYLYENIVFRDIVNPLLLLILLFTGLAYIYADLFEQFMGKLKTLLPRIIFGVILAYTSIYIFEALMLMGKGGYLLFYNAPVMGAWKNPHYLEAVAPNIRVVGQDAWATSIANFYWGYIWVFVVMAETLSLLVFVAFRMVMMGVLLVLLPIASILLIHPWTQQIGSRIWWLLISLIFVPIAMVIPLMLSTVVVGSVSFTIASLTAVLGSIYLLAKEPFILGGLGFQRAGGVLTGGIIGGGVSGNLLAPSQMGAGLGSFAKQGVYSHALGHAGEQRITESGEKMVGGVGLAGLTAKGLHALWRRHTRGEINLAGGEQGGATGTSGGMSDSEYAERNGGIEE